MTGDLIIPLSQPLTAFGEPVAALGLRRPKFRDVRDVQITITAQGVQVAVGSLIPVIAALARLPVAAIEDMDIADVQAVVAAVIPLLLPSDASPAGAPAPSS